MKINNAEASPILNIKVKFSLLNQVYNIYQQAVQDFSFACERKCARCCTRNVTLTELEAQVIVEYMRRTGKMDLFHRIIAESHLDRYQPQMTTNQFANMCARGQDPVEEGPNEDSSGACPLLENDECMIYHVRPFGCRCFFSDEDCRKSGYASLDPFVLTLNNMFLQYIEQIDADGKSGNLSDVLLSVVTMEDLVSDWNPNGSKPEPVALISNHKMEVLMIPPEHRRRIETIIAQLRQITV